VIRFQEIAPINPAKTTVGVIASLATTFAVSWKPFVKSKARAVPTTITKMTSLCMTRSS